jgi:hypothetical protein
MSTPIFQTFGLSEPTIPQTSNTLLRINPLMQLLSSMILRKAIYTRRVLTTRDWGRDTQIIVDLALSPDRTFGNRSRLSVQARDGSAAAIILSA